MYKLTLEGPAGADLNRIAKALRYLINAGSAEWDEPIPEVAFEKIERMTADQIFETIEQPSKADQIYRSFARS